MLVRITPKTAHFEQSFSDDGGKTWEVNWITDQTRVGDEPAKGHELRNARFFQEKGLRFYRPFSMFVSQASSYFLAAFFFPNCVSTVAPMLVNICLAGSA